MRVRETRLLSCFALLMSGLGCGIESAEEARPDPDRPSQADRHDHAGKADGAAAVRRVSDRSLSAGGSVTVRVATQGIRASRVGVIYYVDGRTNPAEWEVVDGTWAGEQAGQALYDVTVPIGRWDAPWVRYAVFAAEGPADARRWHYDSNGGSDYFIFPNLGGHMRNGGSGLLYSLSHRLIPELGIVQVHPQVQDLGLERVTVLYGWDGGSSEAETPATYVGPVYSGTDRYIAEIPVPTGARELRYRIRVDFDGGTFSNAAVADNSGHLYRVPVVAIDQPAAVLRFVDGQAPILDGALRRGGLFTVIYERAPACTGGIYDYAHRNVDVSYQLYEDDAYWVEGIGQKHLPGGWTPEIMQTPGLYIPSDATRLSLWFRHNSSGYTNCEHYDSQDGANYSFAIE